MKFFLISAFVLISSALNAQQTGGVNGRILDKALNNEPMLLATVVLKSTGQVFKTNLHGKFEISEISTGRDTLVVTHPGYETLKVGLYISAGQELAVEQSMMVMSPDMDEVDWTQLTSAMAKKAISGRGDK